MKLTVAWIGKTKEPAIDSLTNEYLKRLSRYVVTEHKILSDESALLNLSGHANEKNARSQKKQTLILLDSRGRQFSSEELAKFIGDYQERNPLPLLFAVGPANGFSDEARKSATMMLSLGNMTIAHELARVILLEQLYRAFTILKGHPYHTGH